MVQNLSNWSVISDWTYFALFCVRLGSAFCAFPSAWDSQIRISANFFKKLDSTVLFKHLKIILLQWFQFSAINGIQTDPLQKNSVYSKCFLSLILLSVLFKTFCQIQMIRDPQRQLEMVGVPEEHLSGHAFHMYHLTSPDQT